MNEQYLHIRLQHQFRLRRTEWVAAVQMLLWGMVLLLPNEVFASPSFALFSSFADETTWGVVAFVLGVLRLTGLIVNGARRKVTPWVRLLTALAGCGFFTAVTLCFAASGNMSTWLAAWPVAAVVEVFNIYDTARDARASNG